MSFPNIPNVTPTINLSREDVINLLLASVAFEELGLAHIINAEAEKIQAVVGTLPENNNVAATNIGDLITINDTVNRTLKTVLKTQMLLQFKLEDILETPFVPTPPPDIEIIENTGTVTGFFNGIEVTDSDVAFYYRQVAS